MKGGGSDVEACQKLFADFARQTAAGAPLYSALTAGIAKDRQLAGLLLAASPTQRLPVLLLACVHRLLLDAPDAQLARHYPNLAGRDLVHGDPFGAFKEFCAHRNDALRELLATRRTQTNEIGRTALLVPTLAMLEREVGELTHVDVGASAGLNLLLGHYDFRYDPGGTIEAGSSVCLLCDTRGAIPVPPVHPAIARAIGIDPTPIDVDDRNQARWLEACVWPDHVERFERLRSAIAVARDVGVDLRTGDAVDDVAATVGEAAVAGHPAVTTTWVMNYLAADERADFVAAMDHVASGQDCSWVYAESPALCPDLPGMPVGRGPDRPTAVVVVRWRDGQRSAQHVADAHPHGAWMHWIPDRR